MCRLAQGRAASLFFDLNDREVRLRAKVSKRYDWAVRPVSGAGGVDRVEPPIDGFRHYRSVRSPERCAPRQRARASLLTVRSPVNVTFKPLVGYEFVCAEEKLGPFAAENGFVELWQRNGGYIAFTEASGLRQYDFAGMIGWEAMFLPNGSSTWEWRLGLNVELPDGSNLITLPCEDQPHLHIEPGILTGEDLKRMNATSGLSIAVRPLQHLTIKRGDPIATLLAFERVIKLDCALEDEPTDKTESQTSSA